MSDAEIYRRASNIIRAAMMDSNKKGDHGPEWHPVEQDPLAWWGGVEAIVRLVDDARSAAS